MINKVKIVKMMMMMMMIIKIKTNYSLKDEKKLRYEKLRKIIKNN